MKKKIMENPITVKYVNSPIKAPTLIRVSLFFRDNYTKQLLGEKMK